MDLSVEPIVTGRVIAQHAPLRVTSLDVPDVPERATLGLVSIDVAQVLKDKTDLGKVSYENPFASTWPVVLSAHGGSCQSGICAEVGYATTTLTTTEIAPLMPAVGSPKLNGTALQVASSAPNSFTLSWNAPTGLPSGLTLYGYRIQIDDVDSSPAVPTVAAYTAQTSATIAGLSSGNYVITIEALADGGLANIASAPYHWKYPTAYADVISGIVAIAGP